MGRAVIHLDGWVYEARATVEGVAADAQASLYQLQGLLPILLSLPHLPTLGLSGAAFAAAALSGFAGFGGALLLLPLLIATVGPRKAVPLLTVCQLVGNLVRVLLGWREVQWRPVATFLMLSLPASGIAAATFTKLPGSTGTRLVGVVLLLFIGLGWWGRGSGGKRKPAAKVLVLACGGAVTGCLSGLAGSAGPVGAAVFMHLDLPPEAYVSSEAAASLLTHAAKMAVYYHLIPMNQSFWEKGACMSVAMALGTILARRMIVGMAPQRFQKIVTGLMIATAGWMLIS